MATVTIPGAMLPDPMPVSKPAKQSPAAAQGALDALTGAGAPAPGMPPAASVFVTPTFVAPPQPSQRTQELQAAVMGAQERLRDEDFFNEAARTRLAQDYVSAVQAPLPAMGERPKLPDAPTMVHWQKAMQDEMPIFALLAVLGAAGTRQPILNAMNAMTAATNALRQGAYDDYAVNLQKWETESKVALDKIKEWQAQRQEILDRRDLSIEQKKAMLEVHDSNAKARRTLLQGDVDTLSGYLEQSRKDDEGIQAADAANAKIRNAAEAVNARIFAQNQRAMQRAGGGTEAQRLKLKLDELRLAREEAARVAREEAGIDLPQEVMSTLDREQKRFDIATRDSYELLRKAEEAAMLIETQNPDAWPLIDQIRISLEQGRVSTNSQLAQVQRTGDIGTRIDTLISKPITGVPGMQQQKDIMRLLEDLTALTRGQILQTSKTYKDRIETVLFPRATPENLGRYLKWVMTARGPMPGRELAMRSQYASKLER